MIPVTVLEERRKNLLQGAATLENQIAQLDEARERARRDLIATRGGIQLIDQILDEQKKKKEEAAEGLGDKKTPADGTGKKPSA